MDELKQATWIGASVNLVSESTNNLIDLKQCIEPLGNPEINIITINIITDLNVTLWTSTHPMLLPKCSHIGPTWSSFFCRKKSDELYTKTFNFILVQSKTYQNYYYFIRL